RTMVDIRPACRVLHTRSLPPAAEKAYENGQQQQAEHLQRQRNRVGWISRKNLDPPVEAELFS
ncbi:MAG: hypothetical protein WA416_16975, partial [Candidatus Sulfotelmatobacter sp.]